MIYTGTPGGAGMDYADLFSVSNNSGRPASGNTYIWDGAANTDTFSMSMGGTYLNKFLSTGFTIPATADVNGLYVISGASTGGTVFNLKLSNVEKLVFSDRTVTLASTPAGPDVTAPVLGTTTLVGTSLVMTYDEALGTTAPLASAFTVAGNTVTNVAISGSSVTLTLGTTVANGASVAFSYTSPASSALPTNNAIQDVTGNDAISVSRTLIAGADTTAPTVSHATDTAVPIASDIVITFSETIHLDNTVTGTPIAIHIGSATGGVVESYTTSDTAHLTVSGNTLTINPTANLAYDAHYYVTFSTATTSTTHHNDTNVTTTTYGISAIADLSGNHLATPGTTPTGPYAPYDFTTAADPYVVVHNVGVDSGPVLVGAGGLGMLAWAFFL